MPRLTLNLACFCLAPVLVQSSRLQSLDENSTLTSSGFQAVSLEEEHLIAEMLTPVFPEAMGRGYDVRDKRAPYNRLQFAAAWKVMDTNPHYQSYLQRVNQSNLAYRSKNRSFWVPTVQDTWQRRAKRIGILGENEYFLFRGASPKRLNRFFSGQVSGRSHMEYDRSLYGQGIYLSDAADKMDQYVRDVENKSLQYLEELVGEGDLQLKKLHKSIDLKLGVMVRAYLGHHIEVGLENLVCWKKPVDQHEKMWYYRDAETREDKEIHDTSDKFNKIPPFQEWDSLKATSRILEPEFFQDIQPGLPLECKPRKHHEYIVADEHLVAAYYLVAYTRTLCETELCKEHDVRMKQHHVLRGDNTCREDYVRNSTTAGRFHGRPAEPHGTPASQLLKDLRRIWDHFLSLFTRLRA